MLSGEAANIDFVIFGLTWPWLEPTIYRTQGEHANHYAIDAVLIILNNIYGGIVTVFASSMVDCGFKPQSNKPKTMKLVIAPSLLAHSIKEKKQRLIGSDSG